MAQELRFVDPAFRCEVVLSGTAKALYESAEDQFKRLKGIRSLGLGAHLHEVARHTRHDHAVGLMRIFNKLCQQLKDKGLPKAFLWSFWPRLCFAQTGHAAMSYDSEKAVLLACHLNSGFKDKLRSLLQPAIDKVAACPTCSRQCLVKDKDKTEANQWFEQMVSGNQWRRLHLWIAATKLVQQPRVLQILAQHAGQQDRLGFSEAEAFKMLLAPDCTWDRPLRNLLRLDFIVRDLTFAGTLAVQLDVDSLVAAANGEHPDWGLLARLDNYMSETLYETLEAQTASVLFQRALAAMLIKGKIEMEALFGVDDATALGDDDLCGMMKKTAAGREVFDPARRRSWRAWRVNTFIDRSFTPCDVERKITGYKKGYLSQHSSRRTTCFKLRQNHWLAVAISHQGHASRPAATAFVKLCRSILKNQYPQFIPSHLTGALFEGLLDRRCEYLLDDAVETLSHLPIALDTLRKAADVVNKRVSARAKPSSGGFSYKIGDYEYPARGDPWNLQVNVMHAALSGDEAVRDNLRVTKEAAAKILWTELLHWQTEYFGLRRAKKVFDLLAKAQEELAKRVIQGGAASGPDLEFYTLLEALRHPDTNVSFRIALPNLKLMKGDGQTENEYDVVSVSLKQDKHVEVWVWGVTAEVNLNAKRNADLGKIQKLKDLLGQRWGDDVRTVSCYIHREGKEICLEIDGKQSRRVIA